MGIPSFYRWLVEKYPLSVVDVLEETPSVVGNGVTVPVDSSMPNPNGIEFDNLYLDMNGIIHPCFHPEDQPAPKTYEEVFKAIFKYIDRLFKIVRPRKLLYMAVDGVAPRAKMNQQRGRRFRAAKDAAEAAAEVERLKEKFGSEGKALAQLEQSEVRDSNIITPGTEFMATLATALQYYIHLRFNGDPGWRSIKVILSDANVPGEGEHKIMSYIRLQRNLPGFDPNTRHCLYGLDADLIMLALATHEIHFVILREDVRVARQNDRSSKFSKVTGPRVPCEEAKGRDQGEVAGADLKRFQFLNVWILRDYLEQDLRMPDPKVKTDLERLVDDFVFICLFVGNDFLPHMPSLEISEGAIDLLMSVYKKEFVRMGGYLTNSFEVDLERVERFIQVVGSHEAAIFRKRGQLQKVRERSQGHSNCKLRRIGSSSSVPHCMPTDTQISQTSQSPSMSLKPGEKELQSSANDLCHVAANVATYGNSVPDQVRLGEEGWRERYYAEKFGAATEDDREIFRRYAVLKYAEGICWVMHYYYQGVCSWQWFYPYHYAPFASDFYGLDQLDILFTLGEPFKPFDQLMGVLPAASAHALPLFYRKLMTDPLSPIADFYPTEFEVDMNGKRYAWQGVSKLPFIKESRLLAEIVKVEDTLTDEEKQRNSLGSDILYVHISNPLAVKIFSFYRRKRNHPKFPKAKIKRKIDPEISGGMNGYIYISDKTGCVLEIESPVRDMEKITKTHVISVFYKYPPNHAHIPRPPEGVIIPRKFLSKQDILPNRALWHERSFRQRILSKRRIPRPVSGHSLPKTSHQLVGKQHPTAMSNDVGLATNGSCISTEGDGKLSSINGKRTRRGGKRKRRGGFAANDSCVSKEMDGERSCVNGKINYGGSKSMNRRHRRKRARKN